MDIIYDGDKIIDGSKRKDCQSCLQEHDRKLKEELEQIIIKQEALPCDILIMLKEYKQFWKERGIE